MSPKITYSRYAINLLAQTGIWASKLMDSLIVDPQIQFNHLSTKAIFSNVDYLANPKSHLT